MPETRIGSLRNAFISGLILLLPMAITWMVFSWLIETVGGGLRPMILPASLREHPSLQFAWDFLATLAVVAMITGLGWLSRYVFGQFFANLAERIMLGIPGIGAIYTTVKQVVDTFGSSGRNSFSKVVLVEYPRKGCWTIGFLTNKARGLPQSRLEGEVWTVFVPTTPNPTSGFLLLVPKEEVVELDMSTGDGMKMVISGGTVVPPAPGPGPAAQT